MGCYCDDDHSNDEYFISGALLQAASVAEWVSWSIGSLLAIAFLGVDGWRAWKKKQHWIPCHSFLLGALTLLLLTLLNMPSAVLHFPQDDKNIWDIPTKKMCCPEFISRRMLVLAGRVSLCVVMGCMLPGLASPRSSTLSLWSDIAALIISCSAPVLHLFHEFYIITASLFASAYDNYYDRSSLLKLWIVPTTVLVAFIILILLLVCAALASITVHKIVSHKIPLILSNSPSQINTIAHSYSESFWERVEDQVVKSWIAVCTSNPQYIIARSILSSSVALAITVCNAILVFEVVRTKFKVSIHMIFHWLVIVLGSTVIYWRWITAVVFCPRTVEKKWASIIKYFQIEDFWKRYLLELKDGHKSHRQMGDSYLKILMLKVGRRVRVYKLIPLVVWLQILLVLFSKVCWLVSQLLLSNMYLRKLVMGSAVEEFPDLYGGKGKCEIEMGKYPFYDKYSKAFVTMNGENAACLWVANRQCIAGINTQLKRGEKEGNSCKALVDLLKEKPSSGYKNMHPQKSVPIKLEVEKESAIYQRSCKMRAVSIITVLVELCPFTQDVKKAIGALEACSQAWSIIDLVQNPDTEAFLVSKTADKLFQALQKRGKMLHNHLGMSTSVENSSEAARVAVGNLIVKAKKVAEEYHCRTWNEVVEGYSLWMVCVNIDFENFIKVEGIMDELVKMLADEIGACMAKALDVIMEDTEKWATMAMGQHIWEAAYIVGKVKGITENLRWMLTFSAMEANKNASATSTGFHTLRKRSSFQIG
ncbi:uncharacterized protein LOC131064696 [Cryptomeria japonica]|uniref:uncharacterized protein LOC131064696 n=1 Tax=Cryptomeria japonica TaxID=3369 RepID=UPI0027D9FBEE|nr:uncharacterized protein LOC131064696 [Cryptomeria japonica]